MKIPETRLVATTVMLPASLHPIKPMPTYSVDNGTVYIKTYECRMLTTELGLYNAQGVIEK